MQITKRNFEENFPAIEEAIKNADFLSYDLEFSSFLGEKEYYSLGSEHVYEAMVKATNKPQILQFGMCCFKVIPGDPLKLVCTPISFTTMPIFSKTFTFNSKSMEFLCATGFDFNSWISNAINYCTQQEYENMTVEYNKRIENEKKERLINDTRKKLRLEKEAAAKAIQEEKNKTRKRKEEGEVEVAEDFPGAKNQSRTNNNTNNNNNNDRKRSRNKGDNVSELDIEARYESFIIFSSNRIVRYYEDFFFPYIKEHRDEFIQTNETQETTKWKSNEEKEYWEIVNGNISPLILTQYTDTKYNKNMRYILKEYAIPMAINTIKENYKNGYVNPENNFKYEGECPNFCFYLRDKYSEKEVRFMNLELYRNEEEVKRVARREKIMEMPKYKRGFMRVLELFKKYRKPLITFSGLGDLFLFFREYVIGYETNILKSKDRDNKTTSADTSQSSNKRANKDVFTPPSDSKEFATLVHKYFSVVIDLKAIFDSNSGFKISSYIEPSVSTQTPKDSKKKSDNNENETTTTTDNNKTNSKTERSKKQYKVRAATGSLEALYEYLMAPKSRPTGPIGTVKKTYDNVIGGPINIQIVNNFGEEPTSINDAYSLQHAHDASYDAYMTGTSFVMCCLRAISYKENLIKYILVPKKVAEGNNDQDVPREEELDTKRLENAKSFKLTILPDQIFLFRSVNYFNLWESDEIDEDVNTKYSSLISLLDKISKSQTNDIYDLSIQRTSVGSCKAAVCFIPDDLTTGNPVKDIEGEFWSHAVPFKNYLTENNLAFSFVKNGSVLIIKINDKVIKESRSCSPNTDTQTNKTMNNEQKDGKHVVPPTSLEPEHLSHLKGSKTSISNDKCAVNESSKNMSIQSNNRNKTNNTDAQAEIDSAGKKSTGSVTSIKIPENWDTEVDVRKLFPSAPADLTRNDVNGEKYSIVTIQKLKLIEESSL